jgi:hypothetical protein
MARAPGKPETRMSGASPFVPAPPSSSGEWTDRIVRCLSVADRLVGELAGQGAQLLNPHVLIRPFVRVLKRRRTGDCTCSSLNSSRSKRDSASAHYRVARYCTLER